MCKYVVLRLRKLYNNICIFFFCQFSLSFRVGFSSIKHHRLYFHLYHLFTYALPLICIRRVHCGDVIVLHIPLYPICSACFKSNATGIRATWVVDYLYKHRIPTFHYLFRLFQIELFINPFQVIEEFFNLFWPIACILHWFSCKFFRKVLISDLIS